MSAGRGCPCRSPDQRVAMINNAEAALAKLTSLSQALNSASDQLSQQISEIESALDRLNPGVWAWVKDDPLEVEEVFRLEKDGKRSSVHHIQQLGYGKHNGVWGFIVASGTQESWDRDVAITFLRDTPLGIRLRAIERIPKLLDLLAEGLTAITQEATQKAAEAKEIAVALRKS